MRILTKFHAPPDYIVGVALIAAPWIFQFSEHTAATVVPIVLGIGLIGYSLFTDYEPGVWKVAPMAVHNLIDVVAGTLLALSPWLFGFADEGVNVSSSPRLGTAPRREPRPVVVFAWIAFAGTRLLRQSSRPVATAPRSP